MIIKLMRGNKEFARIENYGDAWVIAKGGLPEDEDILNAMFVPHIKLNRPALGDVFVQAAHDAAAWFAKVGIDLTVKIEEMEGEAGLIIF